mgnify:CR=1 FL=1
MVLQREEDSLILNWLLQYETHLLQTVSDLCPLFPCETLSFQKDILLPVYLFFPVRCFRKICSLKNQNQENIS